MFKQLREDIALVKERVRLQGAPLKSGSLIPVCMPFTAIGERIGFTSMVC